jgi:hypothetical protein
VILKAGTVSADRRKGWVSARVGEGVDAVMSHRRLVQTGMDLLDFPSLVWYQPDYSTYTVRQASRRSWRIGQRRPVEVTFLVYAQTLQADALGLIAAKVRSALTIEGELPENGLASLEGDDHDVFLALARRLIGTNGESDQSLEEILASVRQSESEADDYLVDDGWVEKAKSTQMTDIVLPVVSANGSQPGLSLFDQRRGEVSGAESLAAAGRSTKIVTFDELARLVRRRRSRRKVSPVEQGQLFDG